MPLILAELNEDLIVKEIELKQNVRKHLENLGLTIGTSIKILAKFAGNVIVQIKDARVAISKDVAEKIIVE